MNAKRLAESALALAAVAYWMAAAGTKPVVSLLAADMLPAGPLLGIVISGQALLPLFLAIPVGKLSDRIGQRSILIGGGALMLLAGLLYLRASSPLLLFLSQTVSGLGQVAVWLSAQALSTGWTGSPEERGRVIGRFTLFVALGQSVAPLLSTQLLDRFGSSWFFLFYIALSAILVLSGWLYPSAMSGGKAKHSAQSELGSATLRLIADPGMQATLICTFLMLALNDLQGSFLPIYMKQVGLGVDAIGYVLAAGSVASLVVRMATGKLLGRWGMKWSLVGAFALAIGGMALVPLFQSVLPLMLLSVITSLGLGVNQPLTLLLIADTTSPDQRGLGMGLRLTANRLAQMVNPVVFGLFATSTGMGPAFVINAGLLSGVAVFVLKQLDRTKLALERSTQI